MIEELLYSITVIGFFSSIFFAAFSLKKYMINALYNIFSKKSPHKIHPYMDNVRKAYLGGYIVLSLILLIGLKRMFHYSKFSNFTEWDYYIYPFLIVYTLLGLTICWFTNSQYGLANFKKGMMANKKDVHKHMKKIVPPKTIEYVRNYSLPNHLEIADDRILEQLYKESKIFTIDLIQFKNVILGTIQGQKFELDYWGSSFYRNQGIHQKKFVRLIFDCFVIDFDSIKLSKNGDKALRNHIDMVIDNFDVQIHKDRVKEVYDELESFSRRKK